MSQRALSTTNIIVRKSIRNIGATSNIQAPIVFVANISTENDTVKYLIDDSLSKTVDL